MSVKIYTEEELLKTRVCDWCEEDFLIYVIGNRMTSTSKLAGKINQDITFGELFHDYSLILDNEVKRLGIKETNRLKCYRRFLIQNKEYDHLTERLGIKKTDRYKYYDLIDCLKAEYFGKIKNEPYYTYNGTLYNQTFEKYEGRWDVEDWCYRHGENYYLFKENWLGKDFFVITNDDYEPIGTTYDWEIEEALEELDIKERTEDISI